MYVAHFLVTVNGRFTFHTSGGCCMPFFAYIHTIVMGRKEHGVCITMCKFFCIPAIPWSVHRNFDTFNDGPKLFTYG